MPEVGRNTYVASLDILQRRGFTADTFVDIGAAEATFFFLRQQYKLLPQAQHFFIDAMHENESIYQQIQKKTGVGYEICALSSMEGQMTMNIDPSFYNTHIQGIQPKNAYAETRQVPVHTLDSVCLKHGLGPSYALKLDVQGAEIDVLRGATKTLENSVVVVAECRTFGGQDSLVDLLNFMQSRHFALYDITDQSYYPSDHTFFECYATFIPERLDFRNTLSFAAAGQQETVRGMLAERRRSNIEIARRFSES
jgi:FkbM family methyltransferase